MSVSKPEVQNLSNFEFAFASFGAFLTGVCITGSLGISSSLSRYLDVDPSSGNPTMASSIYCTIISFGTQAIILGTIALFERGTRSIDLTLAKWWQFFGGATASIAVFLGIFGAPTLGFQLVTVIQKLSQMTFSLVVDRCGFLGLVLPRPGSPYQLLGVAFAASGVLVSFNYSGSYGKSIGATLGLAALILLAGVLETIQPIMNPTISDALGSKLRVAVLSASMGTCLLSIVAGTLLLVQPPNSNLAGASWWMWCSGIIGAEIPWGFTMFPQKIGISTFCVLLLAGQIASSLLQDWSGIFGNQKPVEVRSILGALLCFGGVVCIQYASRFSRKADVKKEVSSSHSESLAV